MKIRNFSDRSKTVLAALLLGLLILPVTSYAADPSIATSETVANVAVGTDDQTASTAATQANVEEVKASRTLTVGALPGNNETITVGTCVITYASSTGATNDEINCTDNAAAIDRDTGAGNTPRTATDIAGIMRTLTNVSDTGHGALTVTGSGTRAIFTTTNTESSATAVTFTDGTAGDITSTSSTTGVIPVAQINTITIAGTVDTGDVFTATLPTVGAVTYTVTSSDSTTSHIATGLNAAIQASSGYASQAFTSAASTNTVVLTAKVAGTGFTQTSSAINRAAAAQVVVFTPADLAYDWVLTITINNTDHSYTQQSGDSTQQVVEALQSRVDTNSAVSCTEDNVSITCTAASAGTAFTYSTSVSAVRSSSAGGIRYGCKDKSASNYEYFAQHKQSLCKYSASQSSTQQTLVDLVNSHRDLLLRAYAGGITLPSLVLTILGLSGDPAQTENTPVRDLTHGMEGNDVRMLQRVLNTQGFAVSGDGAGSPGSETTYFGVLTQKALVAYQSAKGITPASGYFGPLTRAQMKSSGVSGLWW